MEPSPVPTGLAPGSGAVGHAGNPGPLDIGGVWNFAEETSLVFPGELALALGAQLEGPVLHLTCISPEGVLTLNQNGSSFTGTLVHPVSTCQTKGGQAVPPPWPMPFQAVLSGRVAGRSLHIEQFDDPPDPAGPVTCTKNGTITAAGGQAVGLSTTGRCDLSMLPFRPATATNSGTAARP